jgi:hypothetical protein
MRSWRASGVTSSYFAMMTWVMALGSAITPGHRLDGNGATSTAGWSPPLTSAASSSRTYFPRTVRRRTYCAARKAMRSAISSPIRMKPFPPLAFTSSGTISSCSTGSDDSSSRRRPWGFRLLGE